MDKLKYRNKSRYNCTHSDDPRSASDYPTVSLCVVLLIEPHPPVALRNLPGFLKRGAGTGAGNDGSHSYRRDRSGRLTFAYTPTLSCDPVR